TGFEQGRAERRINATVRNVPSQEQPVQRPQISRPQPVYRDDNDAPARPSRPVANERNDFENAAYTRRPAQQQQPETPPAPPQPPRQRPQESRVYEENTVDSNNTDMPAFLRRRNNNNR
ncbi:MAG: hypothetical protein ACPG7F_05690, partial [Aggregatilineales bacterium]